MTPSGEDSAGRDLDLEFSHGCCCCTGGGAPGAWIGVWPPSAEGRAEGEAWGEGERLWLEGARVPEGSAFLDEPLNFRQTWPLPHGGSRWQECWLWKDCGLHHSPPSTHTRTDNAPPRGRELTASGRPEDSKPGVAVLRKGKYLLNKTKPVSAPFFSLC